MPDLNIPASGTTGTLLVDLGEGAGALEAGAAIEVIDVHQPGVTGVGYEPTEPVVVFAVWEHSTVLTEERIPAPGIAVRHLSRALSVFDLLVVLDADRPA